MDDWHRYRDGNNMVKVNISLFLDNSEASAQPQRKIKCGV